MKPPGKTILWVILFSIAMAFMESAVVVYLRELFYKGGFQFPLQPVSPFIAKVEFMREIATIIMLAGIGIVSGNGKLQRFAYFVFAFAIWDLFYYIFLYICLGWPRSLQTWDILFLVPVPWVGPVWAPCLLCLLMITGSLFVIRQTQKNSFYSIQPFYWWLLISGTFVCILSFMWDYLRYAGRNGSVWHFLSDKDLFSEIGGYTPTEFNYTLFLLGFFPMCASVILSILKTKAYEKK